MTALQNLTGSPGGRLLALCAVLLMTGQLFVCLQAQGLRRSKDLVLLHLLHACIGIALTACLLDGIYHLPNPHTPYASIAPVVHRLFALPWAAIAAAELLSAGLLALGYRNNRRFARSHLPSAIKEAVDRLPDGICFGNESGAVVLSNLRMNALCRALFGARLSDTNAFWQQLCARGEDQNGQKLVKTADGEALLFQRREIAVEGRAYTQFVASDVTAQYRITEELARKNARLRDIQLRMKAYQAQAADIVISQEILNARQLVHDEVGHVLLAARYYFEHPGSGDEAVLLTMMKRTNTMLLREAELPDDLERDRYRDALKMASAIGVTVEQSGAAPEAGPVRELLGQAISECAANAAKHAEGDRLFVTVLAAETGFSFTVTNNGLPPKEPVVETGGLLTLRRAVEKTGGPMTVESAPAFRLVIALPSPE